MTVRPCSLKAASNRWWGGGGGLLDLGGTIQYILFENFYLLAQLANTRSTAMPERSRGVCTAHRQLHCLPLCLVPKGLLSSGAFWEGAKANPCWVSPL